MVAYAYAFLCNNFLGVPRLLRIFVFPFALPFLSLLSIFSNFIFILTTGTWHFLVFCKTAHVQAEVKVTNAHCQQANNHFDIAHIDSTMGKKKMVILVLFYIPTSDHYRTNDSDDLAIFLLHEISLQVHNIHLAKSNHSNGRNYLS